MLTNDAQAALANVFYPSADEVLDPPRWNSHCRELASADIQAAQKSRMISMRSILFDLHMQIMSRIPPGVYSPKGLARKRVGYGGRLARRDYS